MPRPYHAMACQHLIHQRGYLDDPASLREAYQFSRSLFARLQAFRRSLTGGSGAREESAEYETDAETPFDR